MEGTSGVKKRSKARKKQNVTERETDKRSAHNAVECRRKQKITRLVTQLGSLVEPSCHCGKETKVDVLQKAVEKIQQLKEKNEELERVIEQQNRERTETQLQQELAVVLVERINLMFKFLNHKKKEEERDRMRSKNISNTPPTNERCGFGVADLLESYSRQTPPLESLGGNTVGEQDHQVFWESSVAGYTPPFNHGNPPVVSNNISSYPQSLDSPSLVNPSSSNWQSYHQQQEQPGMSSSWGQTRLYPPVAASHPHVTSSHPYYNGIEPHPSPHPSSYLHDPNRSTVSNTVWRPYNDHQPPQQTCLSSQTSSSFLVGQLLENLL